MPARGRDEDMEVIYVATDRERELATAWHGGQSSMLYAVSSTGGLTRGTIRPSWSHLGPMTDVEWDWDLASRLLAEVQEVANCTTADEDDRAVARDWFSKIQSVRDLLTAKLESEG